jgi:two-component system NtrC family sensor kinase
LGLSICFGIISEHKGRIWAEDSTGQGAIFYIELPLIPVQEPAPISVALVPPAGRPAASSSSLRILAIDDEPHLRDLLCRVLNRLGHKVETAPDGAAALQNIDQQPYDLIICDVIMPDILGPELYERAVRKYPGLTKRFIFITGNVVDIDTRLFLEKSDLPWLAKPFLPADIEQAIAKTVARVERHDPI